MEIGILVCYIITYTSFSIFTFLAIFSTIRYFIIRKSKDFYLQYIIFWAIILYLLELVFIISRDLIIQHKYSTFSNQILGVTIGFGFVSLVGSIIFVTSANYYVKFEDDRMIAHSIWFSKKILFKDQFDIKKSFWVICDDMYEGEYFVFCFDDKYYILNLNYLVDDANTMTFFNWVQIKKIKTTDKKYFKEFKKNNKYIFLGSKFI